MDNKISMQELLEKFKDSEMFSLTGDISGVKITVNDKFQVLKEIKEVNKDCLRKQYNDLKERVLLIPFDELYQEIEKECLIFKEQYKAKYLKKYGIFNNSFIGDHVEKDTKYYNPPGYFWSFYHSVGLNLDREEYLDELIKENNQLTPLDIIGDKVLKDNLVKYEISFFNHCTERSILMINYYFYLNEDTKKWLLQFTNDFEITGNLEDLAFYKNGEIVFSSCTHEQFNSLDETNY